MSHEQAYTDSFLAGKPWLRDLLSTYMSSLPTVLGDLLDEPVSYRSLLVARKLVAEQLLETGYPERIAAAPGVNAEEVRNILGGITVLTSLEDATEELNDDNPLTSRQIAALVSRFGLDKTVVERLGGPQPFTIRDLLAIQPSAVFPLN